MMRQMDTMLPPDLSCDYIEHNVTKKPGTIYGGSCTFLSDKQSVLFTAIRVNHWTPRFISFKEKLMATRQK